MPSDVNGLALVLSGGGARAALLADIYPIQKTTTVNGKRAFNGMIKDLIKSGYCGQLMII